MNIAIGSIPLKVTFYENTYWSTIKGDFLLKRIYGTYENELHF